MARRIVLYGATGYTGDLTARALVRRGLRPVLAGRDAERLRVLAGELGDLDTAVADSEHPETVHALVEHGDVLVSAVGPFSRWGGPAVQAAVRAGAHYLDCSGEPRFVRDLFERQSPLAERAGCTLLTAFGYEWLPGNLAGALALREAGADAVSVEVGYFAPGTTTTTPVSAGTRSTLVSIMLEPAFAWRAGRLVSVRAASSRRTFELPSGSGEAISVGGSEHIALPRLAPGLRDVGVYIGWLGWLSRPAQAMILGTSLALGVPGMKSGLERFATGLAGTVGDGPGAGDRVRTRSIVVAEARGRDGALLSEVRLEGIDPYELTAGMLAWGAERARDGALLATGTVGPVEAFGLTALEAGVAESGLARAR